MSPPNTLSLRELPVADMGTAEMFVVTVLRLWVECWMGMDNNCQWRSGLLSVGMVEKAQRAFDSAMLVITLSTKHPLDIRGKGKELISTDELRFLNIVDFLQQNSFGGAAHIMSKWLPPAAVSELIPLLYLFAVDIVERGLKLPGCSRYEVFHRLNNYQKPSGALQRPASVTIH